MEVIETNGDPKFYPEAFPFDALAHLIGYLTKSPDHDLKCALESLYGLTGFCMKMFVGEGHPGKIPQLLNLGTVHFRWPREKYAGRLQQLFAGDMNAEDFPWHTSLEILLNLQRALLSRV